MPSVSSGRSLGTPFGAVTYTVGRENEPSNERASDHLVVGRRGRVEQHQLRVGLDDAVESQKELDGLAARVLATVDRTCEVVHRAVESLVGGDGDPCRGSRTLIA